MIRQFMSNVSMTTNMEKLLTLGRTLFKVEGCGGGGGEGGFCHPLFFFEFFFLDDKTSAPDKFSDGQLLWLRDMT